MTTIDPHTPISVLREYLETKGWISHKETILSVSKPGEGNMNVVLRVETDQRAFILKQSRPYVQKYPQIPAPLDRITVEYRFYDSIQGAGLSSYVPEIIGYSAEDYLLVMEDLGKVKDMTQLYVSKIVEDHIVKKLVGILAAIHKSGPASDYPSNIELRQLNHQHVFALPFLEDNGFNLDDVQPGLEKLSLPYKTDEELKKSSGIRW